MGAADPSLVTRDAVGTIQPLWIVGPDLCVIGFTALGEPKPKARARVRTHQRADGTSFAQTYTPDTTVDWENQIGWQAKQAIAWILINDKNPPELPFSKRVMMTLRFNFRRPKSLPKRITHPITGADIDNLEKSVLDALQGVNLIANDRQVTDLDSCKRYEELGHPQGVEIELSAWL
jgi:Holliday junction resolvase RusA-like endonuclease